MNNPSIIYTGILNPTNLSEIDFLPRKHFLP